MALYWQRADGTGTAERLTKPGEGVVHGATAASPDGAALLVDQTSNGTTTLMALSLTDGTLTPFGGITSATRTGATFSPDSRWVTYSTRAPGRQTNITFVQPFPAAGAQYQISREAEDGHHQVWAADGTELFYTPGPGNQLTAVAVTTAAGFAFGQAQPVSRPFLNEAPQNASPFDIGRGQRVVSSACCRVGPDSDRRTRCARRSEWS